MILKYTRTNKLYSRGEDEIHLRKIYDTVDISQAPLIMQAMGYYPSEHEIDNIINEVRYSKVEANCGLINTINFEDLIKRIINYKKYSSSLIFYL